MESLSVYPWHRVPDEVDPKEVAIAHADCYNTSAGFIVLQRMYWGYVMASVPLGEAGQRHQGKIEMFREIIDMMQQGETARRTH